MNKFNHSFDVRDFKFVGGILRTFPPECYSIYFTQSSQSYFTQVTGLTNYCKQKLVALDRN